MVSGGVSPGHAVSGFTVFVGWVLFLPRLG